MDEEIQGKILIAGAGLVLKHFCNLLCIGYLLLFSIFFGLNHKVGSLDALYFANHGYNVCVFESRPDPRREEIVAGRSINLALSKRGIESLKRVGVDAPVVGKGIPMHSRMIHSHSGDQTPIPYGKKDQHILSVDRRKLNELLIDVSEKNPRVQFYFNHKIISADLDNAILTVSDSNGDQRQEHGDLIIGCDGAFSTIRKSLMRKSRMDYNQTYIPHGYKEIEMPPNKNGDFMMDPNHLHIWPRNTFMMIALPNLDKTFTCTLFMPYAIFESIHTEADIIAFFEREFPDSIPLIGRDKIISDYKANPVGDLISIKCKPYHYKDKLVIKGDAAHAMVPFYGQGMNCGFEDCRVFSEIFEKNGFLLAQTLEEYSLIRNPDVEAMCDLAMYNYLEMRAHVNSKLFLLRKHLDNFLQFLFPNRWIPLYTMVTFSTIPYHEVINRRKKQDELLSKALRSFLLVGGVSLVAFIYMLKNSGFQHLPKLSNVGISFLEFK